jgi:hypothetical protein
MDIFLSQIGLDCHVNPRGNADGDNQVASIPGLLLRMTPVLEIKSPHREIQFITGIPSNA